ncbi:disease resistance protein At4g27190-like [Tasmannia lanceolata]|uniref:disease resistance protein At4g27190-like n=1 Tax=Tasmannia lanceolata TaxID=3420 RepID=UPI004064844B
MDAVISVLIEIGKYSWDPLKEHIGYLIHFKSNIENLKSHGEELVSRRNDIRSRVNDRCLNGDVVIEEVQLWLTKADEMESTANEIERNLGENMRCLKGCCPNWNRRYRLSKKAKENAEIIIGHYNKGIFQIVSIAPPPSRVEIQPTPSVEGLTSVNASLDEVMDALTDENVRMIGVYGMGGVGKTTLVKNVNNKLKENTLFDEVVMVTVSKDVTLKRVQEEIANRCRITLKSEIESIRANELRARLMKVKTLLIILDDLWAALDIDRVGIPFDDHHKGCKIVLTSRSKDVCRQMGSQVYIQVNVLLEDESWKLFKEKVGDVVDHQNLQAMARNIAKECRGLPLALVTLGGALRDEDNLSVWENALTELKRSDPVDIEGMEDRVYQSLRISYNHLKTEELKLCFLFFCLFPEDSSIPVDRVIRYLIGEGILEKFESLEDTMNKGRALIEKLKACCLLLESYDSEHVMMHDVVRDVAIWIASKEGEYRFLVKSGLRLEEWPELDKLEECKRLSLMRNKIEKLPDKMQCLQLRTLMMQENGNLREIPDSFFEGAKELRVLDLGYTSIGRLPPSLSNLTNLRELSLRECQLTLSSLHGLSQLGVLKKLESLDLGRNRIYEVPIEFGELVNLRHLDLSGNDSLEVVPQNVVIKRLARLEELKMEYSFNRWEVGEGEEERNNANARLTEVASLSRLTCLWIDIKDAHRFSQDFLYKSWANLKRFHFRLFLESNETNFYVSTGNSPREIFITGSQPIPQWVKIFLFPTTTYLQLLDCHEFIRSILDLNGFQNLEHLHIRGCNEIECFINGKEASEYALQHLQHLVLVDLQKLEIVVSNEESLPLTTLGSLSYVSVDNCPRLKHILKLSELKRMHNLEELWVYKCENVEQLFVGMMALTKNSLVLSKLQRMHLTNLAKMENMWMGLATLQNLRFVRIAGCHGLKAVLSSVQMKGLPHLEEFTVKNCTQVKKIISEAEEVVGDEKALLSKLKVLKLFELPNVEYFYKSPLDFHSLGIMTIRGCPNLKKLLFEGPQSAPSLQQIKEETGWWEGLKWEEEGDDGLKIHLQSIFTAIQPRNPMADYYGEGEDEV